MIFETERLSFAFPEDAACSLVGRRRLAVIDRLEARVDQLEAENEVLREQLAEAQRSRDDLQGGPSSAETAQSTGPDSFWERLTSRFGATDE